MKLDLKPGFSLFCCEAEIPEVSQRKVSSGGLSPWNVFFRQGFAPLKKKNKNPGFIFSPILYFHY